MKRTAVINIRTHEDLKKNAMKKAKKKRKSLSQVITEFLIKFIEVD